MARIAGIARGNAKFIVDQMLDKIAYQKPGNREIIGARNSTIGIEYTKYEKSQTINLLKQSTVRDGMGIHFAQAQATKKALRFMRDATGVAPLYYGKTEKDELCFASEVKGLMTVTEDIREFPPGNLFDGSEMNSWSVFREYKMRNDSQKLIVKELRETLLAAVIESVNIAAREVGVLLSGGLDSSAIAALSKSILNDRVHTFTIGLDDAPDLAAGRTVAEYFGTIHHSLIVTREDLVDYLPEVIWHLESFDALLVRSSLLHYLIAKMASDYVPFIMVGDGADELFAGYTMHKEIKLSKLPAVLLKSLRNMHNQSLQRVDRCGTAHGLITSLPYLDPRLVTLSIRIPPELKVCKGIGKWCLREAIADLIPTSILNRPRTKFWNSGGIDGILAELARESISIEEFKNEQILQNGWRLDSREELLYYRIFNGQFGRIAEDPTWIGRTIGAPLEQTEQAAVQSMGSGL
jgi:asparagine synthase (glutamine-hydrolysing)